MTSQLSFYDPPTPQEAGRILAQARTDRARAPIISKMNEIRHAYGLPEYRETGRAG